VFGHSAWSQTTRTIKIVVPFAVGGGADILARLMADYIARTYGPMTVIENRPGAAITKAARFTAGALFRPD
jgi:tripartite-type tricarboxylate transporter receptor subunit TctC